MVVDLDQRVSYPSLIDRWQGHVEPPAYPVLQEFELRRGPKFIWYSLLE